MNQRDLSEKLEILARILEENSDDFEVLQVAEELRLLSNQEYAPGNSMTWGEVKPTKPGTKKPFTNKAGKKMPF